MGIDDVVIGNAVSNNAPALGGTPADDTATEDVATAIDLSTYNVSDADGDTVTLTLAVDRGTISSTDGNGTTSSVTVANSGTGSMTLQGTAANLNTYLNDASKITYTTATNDTTTAVLTVTPNDGTVNGAADTVNITISSVNDAPTLSGLPTDLVFTEDTQGSVNLSAATFADVDSASVTVTITASEGSFAAPADGAAVGGGVTEARVNATTISLAGAAADINTYLDTTNNIQWTGATNDTGDNTSTFIVTANDGNGSGDVTLGTINADIAAENDVPVFAALDGTPAFTEGGAAVTLDANVTVSDVELDALNGGNGNYSGASLTVARNGGTNTVDSFGFDTNGASFTVNGGNLQSGGNTFATFTNTGGTLTVNFTSSGATATSALVDEVVQRVAYQNTGNDLSSNPQLDYTLNDGTGTSTGSNQVTVSLTDVNDAPTLTATGGNPGYTEGGGGSDLFNTVSADTIETGQTFSAMTLTVTNVSDGASEILSFDGSDVALTNGTSVTTATNGLS
ncbi:MAG: hemolysin-type calcium-binding region, partial [Alphaproteobacteria bacterium]